MIYANDLDCACDKCAQSRMERYEKDLAAEWRRQMDRMKLIQDLFITCANGH